MSVSRPALGLLQPLLDAVPVAGRGVELVIEERVLRGDPPYGRLSTGVARGEVEAHWDLGPLMAWFAEPGGWRLEDRRSRAWLDLGRAPDDDAPWPPSPDRTRLGWLADGAPLDWGGLDPSLEQEQKRAVELTWPDPLPGSPFHHGQRRLLTSTAPAGLVLERVQELVGTVVPATSGADVPTIADALPRWVREACAPEWPTAEAAARRASMSDLRGAARRRAGWQLRWTPTEVARHLLPTERAWRFLGARPVDDRTLDVAWLQARLAGTTDVARFLLQAAGADGAVNAPVAP